MKRIGAKKEVDRMSSQPFFILSRLSSDEEIVGTSYFYRELGQGQRDAIRTAVPEARIIDALASPAAVEVFVPITSAPLANVDALTPRLMPLIERTLVDFFDHAGNGYRTERQGAEWMLLRHDSDGEVSLSELAIAVEQGLRR